MKFTPDDQIAVTLPVAKALIAAIEADDAQAVARAVSDVAFPKALAVILAAAVDPLLMLDAPFSEVQYDHPALSYHAGRFENGDRDMLARRCFVHRQSIQKTVDAGLARRLGR